MNIILILVLIGFNAFFVAAEYSLLTLRKTKIDQYVKHKVIGYFLVRNALDNLYLIISATQLGSTICNILLGLIGEPIVEELIVPLMAALPFRTSLFLQKTIAVTSTIIILSFTMMIFGEIIPKTIALQKSDIISRIIIIPLRFFIIIFRPIIFFINLVSNIFLKIIRFRPFFNKPIDYSQDEIKIILDEAKKNRIIPHHQARLLSNIFVLQHTPISKLMIEKRKLICFNHDETIDAIRKKISKFKYFHNRYPVYFSKNMIVGYIRASDIMRFSYNGNHHIKLHETGLVKEMLYTHESSPADQLLVTMRNKRIHAAVVLGEKQQLLGIVTLADIIEYVIDRR